MKRFRLLPLLLVILVIGSNLTGCSTFDMVKEALGASSGKGLSVDMQYGDRENELQLGGARGTGKIVAKGKARVTVNTSTAAARVDKAENVTINNFNPWVLGALLGVVILFIPSPLNQIIRILGWPLRVIKRSTRTTKGSQTSEKTKASSEQTEE